VEDLAFDAERIVKHAQFARPRSLGCMFLYVVRAGPYCKVGVTGDLKQRLQTYSTHCPLETSCVAVFEVKAQFALPLEREVHRILGDHRVRGEWFAVEVAAAIEAVEAVKAGGVPLRRGESRAYPLIETIVSRPAQ
jgi:hypothetical protein